MKKIFLITFIAIIICSCKKGWLEERANKSLVVPISIADFQAMLDNTAFMNFVPSTLQISSDDFSVTDAVYSSLSVMERNAYTWNRGDFYNGARSIDWSYQYSNIFYANVVLEGLEKITPASHEQADYNNLKGQAYFHRAAAHYQIAINFTTPFNSGTAATALGIPLRLASDVKAQVTRSTLEVTWRQIIDDATEAANLLNNAALVKTRANKAAAFALMAKAYLEIGNYEEAFKASNSSLQLYNKLIDYNTISQTTSVPFARFNDEVLYDALLINRTSLNLNNALVDIELYNSYESNDLRKVIFYKPNTSGRHTFSGSYTGASTLSGRLFGGIATDEVYLIRAECYARRSMINLAMTDLNTLLRNRYRTGTFIDRTATDVNDAVRQIISERRKELAFRGTRFADLRRYNKEISTQKVLRRLVSSVNYELPPNDARYVLPIPDEVISDSKIPQNPF